MVKKAMAEEAAAAATVAEAAEDVKYYACQYCDRKFYSSQALGGHQNGHKRERMATRRAQKELDLYVDSAFLISHPPLQAGQYYYHHHHHPSLCTPTRLGAYTTPHQPYLSAPPSVHLRGPTGVCRVLRRSSTGNAGSSSRTLASSSSSSSHRRPEQMEERTFFTAQRHHDHHLPSADSTPDCENADEVESNEAGIDLSLHL